MRIPRRLAGVLMVCLAAAQGSAQTSAQPYTPKQSDRPQALPAGVDEPGFRSIFDGKTLAGWEGDPKYWRVDEHGSMVGEITPETVIKSNTFIIWRGDSQQKGGLLRDFELQVDYRFSEVGNSGINYRSVVVPDPVTPANKFAMRGYQCDLDAKNRYTGNNYEEKGRLFLSLRGQVTRVTGSHPPDILASTGSDAELSAAVPLQQWNHVHLIVRGNVLTHIVNGRVMSVTVDDDAKGRTMEGLIGVQVHVGPPMRVEYRNWRLKTW